MARSELVEKYQHTVDKYDLLRQRMMKATEQKEKFKSSVVERVIADYQQQMGELEQQLAPCEEEMFRLVAELEADRKRVMGEKTALDERSDELELRNLIGEFEGDEYEEKRNQLAVDLDDVNTRLSEIEEELRIHRELLEKAGANERRTAPVKKPAAAQKSAKAAAAKPVAQPVAEPEPVPTPIAAPVNGAWHAHTEPAGQVAPVSAFGDGFKSGGNGADLGGGSAFEMILDDFPMSNDSSLSQDLPPLGGSAMDELQNLTELDNNWQKDLSDDFPAAQGFRDMLDSGSPGALNNNAFGNLGFPGGASELPPLGMNASTEPRAAYLIRHFDRADEDRYEIRDDVTSIGRGRDNQIQIKDDTKVSRYHCRILREPTGYYVEDNNSSNGTMVNGELITRRKVEGGEDVTIGETIFRFLLA